VPFQIHRGRIFEVSGEKGPYALVEVPNVLPRATVHYSWQTLSEAAVWSMLAQPEWNPLQTVLLEDDSIVSTDSGLSPSVGKVVARRANRIEIDAVAQADGVLLYNDLYHPGWTVAVDGEPVSMLRCNGVMRGVRLSPGKHRIVMKYAPNRLPFLLSMTLHVAFLGWFGLHLFRRCVIQAA